MSGWYVLRDRQPIAVEDMNEYSRWMSEHKYVPRQLNYKNNPADLARVGWDDINGIEVSTVFLGLDHSFGDGPPVLFETMVFGGAWDGDMERYHTWDEAAVGHELICAAIRSALQAAADAGYEVVQ